MLPDRDDLAILALLREAATGRSFSPPTDVYSTEKKVVIIIEENDHTPPGGHFVGVNGVGYQIQVGKEVTVPRSVLEVLDNAKESVPQTDPSTNSVIGFRDRLRVPYRVVKFLD